MPVIDLPWCDPFEAVRRLAALPRLAFLDSAMPHETLGRWSYVAADPAGLFRVADGRASWNGEALPQPPMAALRAVMNDFSGPIQAGGPPFQGGMIGAIAYEAGHLFERLPATAPSPWPQIDLPVYDTLLAFDHRERRAVLIGRNGAKLAQWKALLAVRPAPLPDLPALAWRDSRTRTAYEQEVAEVKRTIREGDIFQANLSHRFSARPTGPFDPLAAYAALRAANPAPFAALLVDGPRFIASSSPERFLRLEGRVVETRPIKGTIRRAAAPAEDAARARELAASEKDRAENVMIVDLLRNDLSRVCEPGSVRVPTLCGVETYASVHHLTSVVTGRLRPQADIADLIAATFPGGSITGAPKIRAMEIIAGLEAAPRGIYCGAIGWIGFNGDADLNIAIRTLAFDGKECSFGAGGGITLLSDPAAEYEETLAKAARLFAAFGQRGTASEAAA